CRRSPARRRPAPRPPARGAAGRRRPPRPTPDAGRCFTEVMLLTRTVLMRPLRSRVVLPFLCLLGLWGGAAAQPYAAAGGFGRPAQQEARATAASVAVAVSPDGATTTTVWAGREGVWRADRSAAGTAAPVLVAASDDVRTVSAAYLGDELTVTWVTRDRRT